MDVLEALAGRSVEGFESSLGSLNQIRLENECEK